MGSAKNKDDTKLPSSSFHDEAAEMPRVGVAVESTLSASHELPDAMVTFVVWSSDEAVATVSADGVVSAVGAGMRLLRLLTSTPAFVMASATIQPSMLVPAPCGRVLVGGGIATRMVLTRQRGPGD